MRAAEAKKMAKIAGRPWADLPRDHLRDLTRAIGSGLPRTEVDPIEALHLGPHIRLTRLLDGLDHVAGDLDTVEGKRLRDVMTQLLKQSAYRPLLDEAERESRELHERTRRRVARPGPKGPTTYPDRESFLMALRAAAASVRHSQRRETKQAFATEMGIASSKTLTALLRHYKVSFPPSPPSVRS